MAVGKNKVEFDLRYLYWGTYTVSDAGEVTLGTPARIPGIRKLTRDVNSNDAHLAADDREDYWEDTDENGFTGEFELANLEDALKVQFFKYEVQPDGAIAHNENLVRPKIYFMFEINGDDHRKRHIVYNTRLGSIGRERNTRDGAKAPDVVTVPYTTRRDEGTGVTDKSYTPDDAPYDKMFTTPPAPNGAVA
ncbi:MAG: hypothetical protein IJ061_06560 [Lachnospiraceae bacterium]|nr:hypothetical protein [Lachnospiraceae bacterium]